VRRRDLLRGFVAMPVVAFARPNMPVLKLKGSFEEVGSSVLMTLSVPTLFNKYDKDALESIDSGFDTTLHFTLKLWEYGAKGRLMETREVLVRIRRDPWKKRYVVSTREDGVWSKRTFTDREAAVAAAVKLDRVRIASTSSLERGDDAPYYFVTVFAQRNPLEPAADFAGSTSAQGRDLEWFGRLVDVLAGERALAEETVHARTNRFYLVAK
jgi:hypothetical protein